LAGIVLLLLLIFVAVMNKSPVEDRSSNAEALNPTTKFQDRAAPAQAAESPKRLRKRSTAHNQPPAFSVARNAAATRVWAYDGGLLRLEAAGRMRRFYYAERSPGSFAELGAMVFEGVREGPTVSGRAFSFSADCAPIAYQVKGSVSPDETAVKLRGRKPLRDGACKIVDYSDDELNFTLASLPGRT
jgi:hypothetical protein